MALVTVEVPGGIGTLIADVDIVFTEESGRYKWTVGEHDGWADTREEVIQTVTEILRRPYRGVRNRVPRCGFVLDRG